VGAAATWIMLTIGYFLLEVPVMHGRLLVREKYRWYLDDVLRPLIAALLVLALARAALPAGWHVHRQVLFISVAAAFAMLASAFTVPRVLLTARRFVAHRISA